MRWACDRTKSHEFFSRTNFFFQGMHTLGYSIFATFSKRDITEWDITLDEILHENSVWLLIKLIIQNGVKIQVNGILSERDTRAT